MTRFQQWFKTFSAGAFVALAPAPVILSNENRGMKPRCADLFLVADSFTISRIRFFAVELLWEIGRGTRQSDQVTINRARFPQIFRRSLRMKRQSRT